MVKGKGLRKPKHGDIVTPHAGVHRKGIELRPGMLVTYPDVRFGGRAWIRAVVTRVYTEEELDPNCLPFRVNNMFPPSESFLMFRMALQDGVIKKETRGNYPERFEFIPGSLAEGTFIPGCEKLDKLVDDFAKGMEDIGAADQLRESVARSAGKRPATNYRHACVRSSTTFTGTVLADFPEWMDLDISGEPDGGAEDRYYEDPVLRGSTDDDDDEEEGDVEVTGVLPSSISAAAAAAKPPTKPGKNAAAEPTTKPAGVEAVGPGPAAGLAAGSGRGPGAAGSGRGRGRPRKVNKQAPAVSAATAADVDLTEDEGNVPAGSSNNSMKRTTGAAATAASGNVDVTRDDTAGGEDPRVTRKKAKKTVVAATPAAGVAAETATAATAAAAAAAAAAVATATAKGASAQDLVISATLAAMTAAMKAGMTPDAATTIAATVGSAAVAAGKEAAPTPSAKGKGGAKKAKGKGGAKKAAAVNVAQQQGVMQKAKIKETPEDRAKRQAAAAKRKANDNYAQTRPTKGKSAASGGLGADATSWATTSTPGPKDGEEVQLLRDQVAALKKQAEIRALQERLAELEGGRGGSLRPKDEPNHHASTGQPAAQEGHAASDAEDQGGEEGHGDKEETHGNDPPLQRYAAGVAALRKGGSMRVNPTVVPIEDMRYWKTCLDDLRASRTSGFLQLTAIMDGISSRKKGPDGQATTTKISDPVVRGCTMHTAQRWEGMLLDLGDVCRTESCCPKGATVAHAQANHPVAAKAGNKRKANKKSK